MKYLIIITFVLIIRPSNGQVKFNINKENRLDSIIIISNSDYYFNMVFDSLGFLNHINDGNMFSSDYYTFLFKENNLESVNRFKKGKQNCEFYLFDEFGKLKFVRTEDGSRIDSLFNRYNPLKFTISELNSISKYEFDTTGFITRIYESDSLFSCIGFEAVFFNSEIKYVNNLNSGILIIFLSGRIVEIRPLLSKNQNWNIRMNYKKNKLNSIVVKESTSTSARILKFRSNGFVKIR